MTSRLFPFSTFFSRLFFVSKILTKILFGKTELIKLHQREYTHNSKFRSQEMTRTCFVDPSGVTTDAEVLVITGEIGMVAV